MRTSANHRRMVEMSQTVIICTFFSQAIFWLFFYGRVKLQNVLVYQNRTAIFCPESFVQKIFFASSTKFAKFIEDFACDASAPNRSMQVLPKVL